MSRLVDQYLLFNRIEAKSPATIRDYADELRGFLCLLEKAGHSMEVADVTAMDVLSYLGHLQDRNLAPTTINRAYGNLRTFFNWCCDQEFLAQAPTDKIKPPKVPKIIKPILTQNQIDHVLALCPQSDFVGARRHAMYQLLLTSGMRLGELVGLKIVDLDWQRERIKVLGKGSKDRYVPFVRMAQKAIWRYQADPKYSAGPELWRSRLGVAMGYQTIQMDLKRMLLRAGLLGVVPDAIHSWRRTWAYNSLKSGVPLKYVQLAGGWESVGILEHYVRALDSEDALEAFKGL